MIKERMLFFYTAPMQHHLWWPRWNLNKAYKPFRKRLKMMTEMVFREGATRLRVPLGRDFGLGWGGRRGYVTTHGGFFYSKKLSQLRQIRHNFVTTSSTSSQLRHKFVTTSSTSSQIRHNFVANSSQLRQLRHNFVTNSSQLRHKFVTTSS